MKCKCPACTRTTQVPPDLLDFLSRCDRCGALLRPRLTNSNVQGQPEKLMAQIVISGRYREDPFAQRATVLDVLTPRPRDAATELPSPANATGILTGASANSTQLIYWRSHLQNALRTITTTVTHIAQATQVAQVVRTASQRFAAARLAENRGSPSEPPELWPDSDLLALTPLDDPDCPLNNLAIEAATLAARQRAMRRAQLQTNHHALGWIGACGFGFVLLLGAAVIVLKSTGLLASPQRSFGAIMGGYAPTERPAASTDLLSPAGTQPASTQPGDLFPDVHPR